jgi:TRAP-type mannitol/chloroaromatic compound transport system substrate-binding protein
MLGELLSEVVTKLFEVSDRLKQSKDEDRQRIANYFQKVGDCLLGIAEELRNGNPHHGKWGELQEYAKFFPKVISEAIGRDKENELSLLLEKVVNNTPEGDSDIQIIATTGGKFKALAVNIATEKGKVPPKSGGAVKPPEEPAPVSRRTFVYAAIGTATAIASGAVGWHSRQYKQSIQYKYSIQWKMVSFLGESAKDKVILYKAPFMIRQRLKEITNDQFIIEVDTTGGIPTDQILEKVSDGKDVQCGFSGIYYENTKYRPLYFGCAIPFGLSPQEQTAWLSYKKNSTDKLTYIQNLYTELKLNVIPFPAGATGGQMGGWFTKKINSVADFKGLIMRIPGLGADVLSDYFDIETDKKIFGEALSLEQIAVKLEEGGSGSGSGILAAEWIGPHDDLQLNLHKAGAKYYYYPGWREPSTTFDVQVNGSAWDALPLEYKCIFEAVCYETYTKILFEYDQKNAQSVVEIKRLENSGNIQILQFPDEVLRFAQAKTAELLKKYDKNDLFLTVHKDWEDFKKQMRSWSDYSDLSKIMAKLERSTGR